VRESSYQKKYNKEGGTSPKIRVDLILSRSLYQKLVEQKREQGIAISFFIEKAIEKALREKERGKKG
jgi:post-segregation antitoxin (ccd killing protein)